jgi:hypothetical protein
MAQMGQPPSAKPHVTLTIENAPRSPRAGLQRGKVDKKQNQNAGPRLRLARPIWRFDNASFEY